MIKTILVHRKDHERCTDCCIVRMESKMVLVHHTLKALDQNFSSFVNIGFNEFSYNGTDNDL